MKRFINFSIILGASIFLFNCNEKAQKQSMAANQPMPFSVITLKPQNVVTTKSYPAKIEGTINSEVRSKVTGYIQKVLVDEGQKVSKGQMLFKLETQSLSQDADAAKAAVNVAQVEVDKLIPLVEKGIISNVQLETQKAKLAQAKSNYNSIIANIGYANVKSPVDGYVGAIPFREGSLVSSSNAQPLTTVSQIAKVYAYFSMNETEYLDFLQSTEGKNLEEKISNFPEVNLQLANGGMYPVPGKLETVTGQIDTQTGTVSFRAVFDNSNGLLTNGNSGTILVPKSYNSALVVPQQSTLDQQGQILVFKVVDSIAIAMPIEIIDNTKSMYIVSSGVKTGDMIVATGLGKIRNNTALIPQEIPFDSIAKPIKTFFK